MEDEFSSQYRCIFMFCFIKGCKKLDLFAALYQDLRVHAGDKYFYSVLCSSEITDVSSQITDVI
jgi:hypothetical protein